MIYIYIYIYVQYIHSCSLFFKKKLKKIMNCSSIYQPEPDVAGQAVSNHIIGKHIYPHDFYLNAFPPPPLSIPHSFLLLALHIKLPSQKKRKKNTTDMKGGEFFFLASAPPLLLGFHSFFNPYRNFHFPSFGHHTDCTNLFTSSTAKRRRCCWCWW